MVIKHQSCITLAKSKMPEIEEIIETFLPILDVPRQIGKTTVLKKAARDLKAVFISRFENEGCMFDNKSNYKEIDIRQIKEIRGSKGPVIFDTSALREIFLRVLERIDELKNLKTQRIVDNPYYDLCVNHVIATMQTIDKQNYGSAKEFILRALGCLNTMKNLDNREHHD